jgi:hypothetical protein
MFDYVEVKDKEEMKDSNEFEVIPNFE